MAERTKSLVYVSRHSRILTDAELNGILTSARHNNKASGLTGVLVCLNGRFVQALEGPQDAVEATFARIERDSRHTDVKTVHLDGVETRMFGGWSMGYRRIPDNATAATAESDIRQIFADIERLEPDSVPAVVTKAIVEALWEDGRSPA